MSIRKIKTQTLLYVGLALLIIVSVASAVIISTTAALKVNLYQQRSADAYQLALAGIELAKTELGTYWLWDGLDYNDNDIPERGDSYKETLDLGQGEYWVDLEDVVPLDPSRVKVISHGWVGKAHRIIELVMSGSPPQPPQIDIPNCYYAIESPNMSQFNHSLRNIPGYDPDTQMYSGPACYRRYLCGTPSTNCDLHLADDQASRVHACNVLGFGSYESHSTKSYADRCDNPVFDFSNGVSWTPYAWPSECAMCSARTHNLCCAEASRLPRCSNHRDDDGDGLIDYDGFDVDGDGLINTADVDFWPDPDCDSPNDEDERPSEEELRIVPGTWKEL